MLKFFRITLSALLNQVKYKKTNRSTVGKAKSINAQLRYNNNNKKTFGTAFILQTSAELHRVQIGSVYQLEAGTGAHLFCHSALPHWLALSTSRKLCEPRPFMSWKLPNQKIFLLIKKRDHTRQIWACTCWLQISSSSSSEHSSFSLKGVQSLLHEVIALLYLALRVESAMFYSLHI